MKNSQIYREIDRTAVPPMIFESLVEEPSKRSLNRLIRLTCNLMDTQAAIIYLVESPEKGSKNSISLTSPFQSEKEQIFIHWLCQEIYSNELPPIVQNTREWEFLRDHPVVEASRVRSYYCIPLNIPRYGVYGTFCIMDYQPRKWLAEDIQIVDELTRSMMAEINLQDELNAYAEAEKRLAKKNFQSNRVLKFTKSTIVNMRDIIDRGARPEEIHHYLNAVQDLLDCVV